MRARWTTRAFIRGELGLCIVCRLLMLATAEYPFACKGCCAKARSLEDLVDIYAAGRRFGRQLSASFAPLREIKTGSREGAMSAKESVSPS